MNDTIINHSEEKITEVALEECSLTLHQKGTLLVAMYGATIGKLGILNIESTTNQACCGCKPEDYVNVWYLFYYFLTIRDDLRDRGYGGAQPNISKQVIERLLLPLPPIQEQIRIIEKLQKVEIIINDLIDCHEKFDTINRTISEDIRQSILQFAIKGKLTHHDPNLEPVQIQCKNPIVRRDNSYYETINGKEICLDSEMIYDKIPSNWCLVRLSDVIHLVSGRDLRPEQYNDDKLGIPYITGASNIVGGRVIINRWTEEPVSIAEKGDILISCKGTIGSTCILADVEKVHIARQIMAIRVRDIHTRDFILLYLRAMMAEIDSRKHGTIPGISREDLLSLLIAIPPIDEQTRIVNKVNELLSITNQLSD